MEKRITHFIGVDEAGRGPLAGPVAVGAAMVPVDFDWNLLPGVNDSKQVSPKNREAIFWAAHVLKPKKLIDFSVVLISHRTIDRINVSQSVFLGIERTLKKLDLDPMSVYVKLDGLLLAPKEYLYQETIIKGDAKEKVIGLASILAKVTRDNHMQKIARKYPHYGFEAHKGYGTIAHRQAIHLHGLSPVHRRSFSVSPVSGVK